MLKGINNYLKNDSVKFMISIGLKMSGVYLLVGVIMYFSLWLISFYNLTFLQASGFVMNDEISSALMTYSLKFVLDQSIYFFISVLLVFLQGCYVGYILLRPFKSLGKYCNGIVEGKSFEYKTHPFSELQSLSQMSDYFFEYVRTSLKNKKFLEAIVPLKQAKLRAPEFDKVFFFHFSLIILIIILFTLIIFFYLITHISTSLDSITMSGVSNLTEDQFGIFIKNRVLIINYTYNFLASIVAVLYFCLSFHFYGKVSAASFGFVATMRAYLRGNRDSRVHLIGYKHIREYSRSFNKYLDHVSREMKNKI